jgi:glycolate oxidase FAD binding subunit
LQRFATVETIEDERSAAIWECVRDVEPFAARGPLGDWQVWRIVCPPAAGAVLGERLVRETGGEVVYDWGGGLIWAATPPKSDAQALLVRQCVAAVGGHATLLRASEETRRQVDVFHPASEGVRALSERVRKSFDPTGILNRGRMARGIVV